MNKSKVMLFMSFCIGGILFYYTTMRVSNANDVLWNNVEALASDSETEPNVDCRYVGSIRCPNTNRLVERVEIFSLTFDR